MKKRLFNVHEIADQLGVAATTVYAMCEQKRILHTRVGSGRGTIRISEEGLADYLDKATVKPDDLIQKTPQTKTPTGTARR